MAFAYSPSTQTFQPDEPAAASPSSRGQIESIQALRAIAALLVVMFHITVLWHDRFAPSVVPWKNGNAGVDLFFVISGFIMVVSSRRLSGQPNGWAQFIVLRLVRIAPMYWFASTAKLTAVTADPAISLHTYPTLWNSIASFLFIPARDGSGSVRPLLDVGWTLSFEMLFYIVFAAALFLAIEPLLIVGPAMVVLAMTSLMCDASGPAIVMLASPLALEFAFGVLVGQAYLRRGPFAGRCGPWFVVAMIAGLLSLTLLPIGGNWGRAAVWGLAATMTLAGSVFAERSLAPYLPRALIRIGEASYSLYLTHGFVLPIVGLAMARTRLSGWPLGAVLVPACLGASIMAAHVTYRTVEAPITNRLRRRAAATAVANEAAPQTAI